MEERLRDVPGSPDGPHRPDGRLLAGGGSPAEGEGRSGPEANDGGPDGKTLPLLTRTRTPLPRLQDRPTVPRRLPQGGTVSPADAVPQAVPPLPRLRTPVQTVRLPSLPGAALTTPSLPSGQSVGGRRPVEFVRGPLPSLPTTILPSTPRTGHDGGPPMPAARPHDAPPSHLPNHAPRHAAAPRLPTARRLPAQRPTLPTVERKAAASVTLPTPRPPAPRPQALPAQDRPGLSSPTLPDGGPQDVSGPHLPEQRPGERPPVMALLTLEAFTPPARPLPTTPTRTTTPAQLPDTPAGPQPAIELPTGQAPTPGTPRLPTLPRLSFRTPTLPTSRALKPAAIDLPKPTPGQQTAHADLTAVLARLEQAVKQLGKRQPQHPAHEGVWSKFINPYYNQH